MDIEALLPRKHTLRQWTKSANLGSNCTASGWDYWQKLHVYTFWPIAHVLDKTSMSHYTTNGGHRNNGTCVVPQAMWNSGTRSTLHSHSKLKRFFSRRRQFTRQCSVYVGGATLQTPLVPILHLWSQDMFLDALHDNRLSAGRHCPMLRATATRFLFRFVVNNDYVTTGRRWTVCAVRFLFHLTGFLQHSCGQKYALDVWPYQ